MFLTSEIVHLTFIFIPLNHIASTQLTTLSIYTRAKGEFSFINTLEYVLHLLSCDTKIDNKASFSISLYAF